MVSRLLIAAALLGAAAACDGSKSGSGEESGSAESGESAASGEEKKAAEEAVSEGQEAFYEGDLETAAGRLEEAARLDAANADAWLYLGRVRAEEEAWEEAAAAYRRGLEKHPEDPALHAGLGRALLERGELEGARVHLESALSLREGSPRLLSVHEILWRLGRLHRRAGRTEEAVDAFERAIETMPPFPRSSIDLAKLYLEEGNREEAARVLEAARDDVPVSSVPEIDSLLAKARGG